MFLVCKGGAGGHPALRPRNGRQAGQAGETHVNILSKFPKH